MRRPCGRDVTQAAVLALLLVSACKATPAESPTTGSDAAPAAGIDEPILAPPNRAGSELIAAPLWSGALPVEQAALGVWATGPACRITLDLEGSAAASADCTAPLSAAAHWRVLDGPRPRIVLLDASDTVLWRGVLAGQDQIAGYAVGSGRSDWGRVPERGPAAP